MNVHYFVVFCISRKGGTGEGALGHPQGDMHMVAARPARLGCERAMVGTGWATSHPDCMDRLRKHYSHLASFPGSPGQGRGEPGTFYHVRDVKGRHEVDTT